MRWSIALFGTSLPTIPISRDFEFPLASAATCVWTTDSEVTVTLDYRATCAPGDNVTFYTGVLKVRSVVALACPVATAAEARRNDASI
jgi:hypothetical protein